MGSKRRVAPWITDMHNTPAFDVALFGEASAGECLVNEWDFA